MNKYVFLSISVSLCSVFLLLLAVPVTVFADVWVDGHYKNSGTWVQGHYRSEPDGNPFNNWSFPGNTNPYTGETADGNASTYLENHYNSDSGYSNYNQNYNSYDRSRRYDSYNSYDYNYDQDHGYDVHDRASSDSNEYSNSSYGDYEYNSATHNSTSRCPDNSYYSSVDGECTCYSGYVAQNGSCVRAGTVCKDEYGHNARYNSLSNSCECGYGYILSEGECVSKSQACEDKFGHGYNYDPISGNCKKW
ncbi:MAG: hypothetical protein ACQEP6_02580 [Patescibacteria group bacterium]